MAGSSGGMLVPDKSRSNDPAATRSTKSGWTQICRQSFFPLQLTSATAPAGTSTIEPTGGGKSLFTTSHRILISGGGLVNKKSRC
jgi:hypothetical protein